VTEIPGEAAYSLNKEQVLTIYSALTVQRARLADECGSGRWVPDQVWRQREAKEERLRHLIDVFSSFPGEAVEERDARLALGNLL
jgi:hypothetical protein